MSIEKTRVEIALQEQRVGDDPSIIIYHFEVTNQVGEQSGVYTETLGSSCEARAFIKGLKAMATILNRFDIETPSLPHGR